MYINISKYSSKYSFLSPLEIFLLCAVKNRQKEYIQQTATEEILNRFKELNLTKEIKRTNKSQDSLELLRIAKKGEDVLKDLVTSGEISTMSEKLVDWLVEVYKSRSNGIVKNKAHLKRTCQWYSDQTGITHNRLATMLLCYISDTWLPESGLKFEEFKKENERAHMSMMADNVFWNPSDRFARHYKLEESPLERYRENNREYIEEVWKSKGLDNE